MSGVHGLGGQLAKVPPKKLGEGEQKGPEPQAEQQEEVGHGAEGDSFFNEHNRHTAHNTHTAVDMAKLAKEAPHIAAEIGEIMAHNPSLDTRIVNAMVDMARYAPDLAHSLLKQAAAHPKLGKPLLQAMPKIAKTYEGVLAGLKSQFPRLSEKTLAHIAESSVGRGVAKAIPVVGVGIAAWGTVDTVGALVDPRLSKETKAYYAMASSADWGAAVGGLFAETGIGEAGAVAAAVASIGLFAKAEASKENDLHGGEP
ncbi:MAG TPA: hypothetical protein V6D05_06970 [Stenomitos sp.]